MYKGKFGFTHLDHENSLPFAYYICFFKIQAEFALLKIKTAKGCYFTIRLVASIFCNGYVHSSYTLS